jgi:hypothetical protein
LRPLIPLSFTTKEQPKSSGARAEIVRDPHRRIWERHDESLEAFEKRVEEEAKALHQTARQVL